MAKMFYTLEETAARLGVDQEQVKQMANDGKLQQFRDRNKLMFKRDQVDSLASNSASQSGGPIPLADSSEIETVNVLGDTDTVNPLDATDVSSGSGTDLGATGTSSGATNPNDATGISVFDADEVDDADPMAQTQVTEPVIDDEELALESVGSGSGLLDLTRESDDTSLGVALDEIYPGGEGSDAKMDSAIGSSGVFESALGMETAAGQTAASGLDNLAGEAPGFEPGGVMSSGYEAEPYDPAGSGLGAGLLLGTLVALILGMTVTISSIIGTQSSVTTMLAGGRDSTSASTLWAYLGGLLIVSLVLGAIGMFVGKAAAR